MCRAAGETYDYVVFLRPDVEIQTPFPYEDIFAAFDKDTIVIPDNNWYEGYNDRFAVVAFENMESYSHRIREIADFRKNHGRIVSEKYVKYIVDKYYKMRAVRFQFEIIRP